MNAGIHIDAERFPPAKTADKAFQESMTNTLIHDVRQTTTRRRENHQDMTMSNTTPMTTTRQKKRDAKLVPKEFWVHKSVPKEIVKAAERSLQIPVTAEGGARNISGNERLNIALENMGVTQKTLSYHLYNLLSSIEVIAALAKPVDTELLNVVTEAMEAIKKQNK